MLLAVLRDLFPILAALYVLDAVAWVRAGHLLLVSRAGPWFGFAVREPGIRLAGLLPVDVAFAVARHGPLLTPEGVYLPDPKAYGAAAYDPERWTLLPYDEIERLEVEEDKLLTGRGGGLRLPSRSHAESLAARLREIREAPAAQRNARITSAGEAAFDLDAIRTRLVTFQAAALPVRLLGAALFLVLFAGLPAVLYLGLPPELLKPQLYLALSLFAMTVAALVWAGSHLRGQGALRRRPALSSVLFTPPAAARAAAHLARDLFPDFDAVAVAVVLLPQERLGAWLRGELHAAAWAEAQGDAGWQAAWAARRGLLRRTLDRLGRSESEVLAPPGRDPEAVAWCPFCDTEYRESLASCRDCALPLVALADPA